MTAPGTERSATPAEEVADERLGALRSAVRATVAQHTDALLELSRRIHADPETAFEEHRSAALCAELLAAHGFEVTAPAHGLETAFRATIGSG
nr:amidohydrolase [Streptomyces sp. DSM 41633]